MNHQTFISLDGAQRNATILLEGCGISLPYDSRLDYATALVDYCNRLPLAVSHKIGVFHPSKILIHGNVNVLDVGRPGT